MPVAIKLSPSSAWLLKLFAEKHPGCIATSASLPDAPSGVAQPRMSQVRGLQRRGWIKGECSCVPPCPEGCRLASFFRITGKGLDAAANLGFIPKFKSI